MSGIEIREYITPTNKKPFSDWAKKLESKTRSIIISRLARIRTGNFGDAKQLKNVAGIWEFRVDYGPGYRIYFGKKEQSIIILLIGGSKQSQNRDIVKAKQYWLEFQESNREEKKI